MRSITFSATCRLRSLLVAALVLFPWSAWSQPTPTFDEVGQFYVERFGREDYDTEATSFGIVQTLEGLLYVGNIGGVLEYDGVSWRQIPVPSTVRSLATDSEGRVFIGAVGELGYLAPDSLGRMRYVSLVDHIPAAEREFADVWRIEQTSDGLYFQTYLQLFRWNGREIEVWHPETRFWWMFGHRDSLYIQEEGIGLMRLVDDAFVMEPWGTIFQDRRLQALVPQGEAEYLAITRDDGMFRCMTTLRSEASCTPFRADLTDLLRNLKPYRVAVLPESLLAIGTRHGGVVLIDEAGRLLRILNEGTGLPSEQVRYVYPDRQDGLWLSLDDGIARVEVSALSYFDKADGLLGTVNAVVRHRSRLYAATSRGVFSLQPGTRGAPPRFLPLPGITMYCWSLLSTPQGLLIGSSDGVYNLESGEWFSETHCLTMVRSKRDETLIYVGLSDGLMQLRLREGRWTDGGRIHTGPEKVHSIAEAPEGELWLGTAFTGVLRFDPARAPSDAAAISRFGTGQGLPSGGIDVASVAGRVVFVHRTGLFRRVDPGTAAVRFKTDTTFSAFPVQQKWQPRVVEDAEGRVWLVGGEVSAVAIPQPSGSYLWEPTALRRAPMWGVGSVHVEPDGTLWVGGTHGLIRLDTKRSFNPPASYQVQIRRITTAAGARLYDGKRTQPSGAPTWPYRDNALRINFAAPRHDAPDRTRFRTRLDGLDADWSVWTTEAQRDFTNLWEGRYTFHVQARDVYGLASQEDTFAFKILPPLYRSWWAYTFYGLSLVAVALAYARWHHKNLQRERAVSARLREVDKLKDEFLASTSHELRTPLHGITGLAESLIDGAAGDVPEAVKANLSMIVGSGRRLGQLVNDILDYSRLTHGNLELRRRPIDLHPLAEVALALQKPLIGGKNLELRNAVPQGLPPANADEARLEQIFHNLVGNAIKFTEEGLVEISATVTEGWLTIAVEDTGIGITEDQRAQIFEAFQQADSGVQRAFGGTGLGLTITHKLVELHGGEIRVESMPGEGARFSFTLPASSREAEPAKVAERPVSRLMTPLPTVAHRAPKQPFDSASAHDLVASAILVVDDEPVNLQVLSNHLVSAGHEVTLASSGPQALDLIAKRPFDLVLLDVMMPKQSGYMVCRALRKRHSLEELPVIFLTAKNQVPDLVAGLAAGGNDYLAKPIHKEELLARVHTHLRLLSIHRKLAGVVGDLETKNAELARFNYTIAHDLKNPLVTIKNFLGLARHDAATGSTERLERDFERLESAASRLERLLDELFQLSKVGLQTHPPEQIPFAELVQDALTQLTEPIGERGVEVEVSVGLPAVFGDRARLLEAVVHLLSNAVQYLGPSPTPRIQVGAREREPETIFYVRDNGIGIDPKYHENIFGLFKRLDPGASEGTGIGLTLVKRIIEVHRGRIWVESEGRGRGSTFCFTLPATNIGEV